VRHSGHTRGNYSMLMGFSVVGLLGFGALGVDISYLAASNAQAQAISDAASHAALLAYQNSDDRSTGARMAQGRAAARWVVDNNFVGDAPGEMQGLSFGVFNPHNGGFRDGGEPANAVRVRVGRVGMPTILAGIVGHGRWTCRRAAHPPPILAS
jgi:hypothetical protein